MAAFADRIDEFVRWFFNSSPTAMEIESTRQAGEGWPERGEAGPAKKASAEKARRHVHRSRLQPQQRARA